MCKNLNLFLNIFKKNIGELELCNILSKSENLNMLNGVGELENY